MGKSKGRDKTADAQRREEVEPLVRGKSKEGREGKAGTRRMLKQEHPGGKWKPGGASL